MGSASDWEVMREAAKQLTDFSVPYEAKCCRRTALPTRSRMGEQLTAKAPAVHRGAGVQRIWPV